jgi:hypothetical protein
MGEQQPTVIIPEPQISQLNAAHYRLMLAESELAHAKRNLLDAEQLVSRRRGERTKIRFEIGQALGIEIRGWNETTGEAQYSPLPKPTDPAPEAPSMSAENVAS